MSDVPRHAPHREQRTSAPPGVRTAAAFGVLWAMAVALAHLVGVWRAVGAAAVLLGAAVVLLDPRVRLRLHPSLRLVAAGVAAGALMGGVTLLLYPPVADASPRIAADATRLYARFHGTPLLRAALLLVPVVIGEELVWRGLVQSALARRYGAVASVIAAAALYALAQAPLGSPLLVLVALACGAAWSALRAASFSLVPPIVAHLVWDAIVLPWRPLVVPGP